MRRPLPILALAALLAAGPGCFAVSELDNAMETLEAVSPSKKKAAEPAAVAEPETKSGPSARVALAEWWKSARTPTSGPKDPSHATEIVSCRLGGGVSFMTRTDCEVQGGSY